jgi:hypothetical protein
MLESHRWDPLLRWNQKYGTKNLMDPFERVIVFAPSEWSYVTGKIGVL